MNGEDADTLRGRRMDKCDEHDFNVPQNQRETVKDRYKGMVRDRIVEASMWLVNRAPAIEGEGGHEHTMLTAQTLLSYDLDVGIVMSLMSEWNKKCLPQWDEDELLELIRKVDKYKTGKRHTFTGLSDLASKIQRQNIIDSEKMAASVQGANALVGAASTPLPEKKDDTILAYLAGVLDGEGCVGTYNNKTNGHFQLRITVEMVESECLDLFESEFGGKRYYKEAKSPRKARSLWMVFGSEAESCLKQLRPFLRIKSRQADFAFMADWSSFKNKPLTDKEKHIRQYVNSKIKELNKRGYYESE